MPKVPETVTFRGGRNVGKTAATDAGRIKELEGEVERYREALVILSSHDFTTMAGCRRGQTIAARALRGEPIE